MTAKPDIVERLRIADQSAWTTDLFRDAADEITALRKRLEDADQHMADVNEAALEQIAAAERERDEAYERAAKVIETGEFCRYVEHAQEYCDCRPMAAAIRALAKGEKQQPQKTGD
jgi:hypothetical protein